MNEQSFIYTHVKETSTSHSKWKSRLKTLYLYFKPICNSESENFLDFWTSVYLSPDRERRER
jgi:hypothetical protein